MQIIVQSIFREVHDLSPVNEIFCVSLKMKTNDMHFIISRNHIQYTLMISRRLNYINIKTYHTQSLLSLLSHIVIELLSMLVNALQMLPILYS